MILILQICAIVTSYIIGSFPTAYIVVKAVKGVDVRDHGSGNVGATNVMRITGKKWFVATLIVDILKGFLPVFIVSCFFTQAGGMPVDLLKILCVVAVICKDRMKSKPTTKSYIEVGGSTTHECGHSMLKTIVGFA